MTAATRKDVAWLRRLAGFERGTVKYYRENPQHDVNGLVAKNAEAHAERFERIAKYLDDILPKRGTKR